MLNKFYILIAFLIFFSVFLLKAQSKDLADTIMYVRIKPVTATDSMALTKNKKQANIELLNSFDESAKNYLSWCLLLVGGSIVTFLSTSYYRPTKKRIRFLYLIFPVAWIFIALSINKCILISEQYLGAKSYAVATSDPDLFFRMKQTTTSMYNSMTTYFEIALVLFAIWLITILTNWIFTENS